MDERRSAGVCGRDENLGRYVNNNILQLFDFDGLQGRENPSIGPNPHWQPWMDADWYTDYLRLKGLKEQGWTLNYEESRDFYNFEQRIHDVQMQQNLSPGDRALYQGWRGLGAVRDTIPIIPGLGTQSGFNGASRPRRGPGQKPPGGPTPPTSRPTISKPTLSPSTATYSNVAEAHNAARIRKV